MGTVMAGGVAVPLYPPARLSELEEHLRRQAGILGNSAAAVLIAFPEVLGIARLLRAQVPSLRLVTTVGDLEGTGASGALPTASAGDIAMLQYTSGSTGDPKGVILTHRHLLANIAAMGAAADAGPSDVFVSWLPLYHDMGLIGAWLAGLYWGFQLVLMSPLAFLARPARWLRAISEHQGTLSGAPNFAYELCVRRVTGPELQGADLSSWRLAFNGSEAVSPATLRRFGERFGPFGLRPEVLAPAYGLAEAGVAVTFPPLGRGPAIDVIDRAALARARRAAPAAAIGAGALEVVSCGRPLPGYQIRVLDSSGRPLPERHEGRIEFTGPSVTPGYYRNEAATRELRHGIWADTGDLGYLAGGELYLTGRAKDVIIRGGRNLHPQELEEAVGRLDGVEHAGVAVFGCPDPVRGTEHLIVVAETPLQDPQARAELRRAITALSVSLIGGPPNEVVLAAPGTVPKTSSGKIRRAAARDRYQAGTLGRPRRGIRWQVARFTVSGVRPWLRRAARSGGALAYAGYAWTATALVAIPAWLLVIILPEPRARWAAVRAAGRLLRRLLVIPLTVTGHTPTAQPFVAVANHASFADGLILILCLPEPVCFAAAGRFATNWLTGPFLRRIGCQFVHRAEPAQAATETRRLAGVLHSGRSLAIWPEGALDPAPGLRPFHLGAFDAAVSAAAPVVPVGIRGSHQALRPGTRFPRRYAIHVAIGEPINPAGHGWPAVLALRDQARTAVLALSAEPDLS
jgi:1-acyl-sn-glycerol-3-phosphate acyltransferase